MSGTTINWVYVCYMEDLNKIKQFDWAGAICNYLLKSTHVEHKDPKEVKDSSILLLQDQVQQDAQEKDKVKQHEVVNGEFVELVQTQFEVQQTQFEVQQDEGEKVKVAEVENVPDSCGLDDFNTLTNIFQSPPCSYSTLKPNTLSGKSLPQEEDECLKKLVDIILDDSKKYAPAMLDESTEERHSINDNLILNDTSTKIKCLENEKRQMEIEKESICEPLNDEIAKLKKLVKSQDKQIVMLKDVMNKGPLTMMHELKNQKQSSQNDLIEKVESLEKKKKQLEVDKLKMQEDNNIVLQSKDQ
ncbi:hypothetical protein RHSIM_Rhsim07G0172300 [Rhododendron simsii]|uniref:Uncharacterized protein n=1 Tax=Rhododendron simsii TaxID=118357 RepID=A0A834LJ97_RHOSS|nr:hypothetical protein RHSIM_Rhsim07G0172300 [Rhododendron simsii]